MTAALYVTVGEAADSLGVSTTTIVRMFDEGLIDGHVLPSGHRRINSESLAAIRERGQA